MSGRIDPPANWYGRQPRFGSAKRRTWLHVERLEHWSLPGSFLGGLLSAAFDGPLSDSAGELARLVSGWTFLDRSAPPTDPLAPQDKGSGDAPRKRVADDDELLAMGLQTLRDRTPPRSVAPPSTVTVSDPLRRMMDDLPGMLTSPGRPLDQAGQPPVVGPKAEAVFLPGPVDPPNGTQAAPSAGSGVGVTNDARQPLPNVRALTLYKPIPNNSPVAVDDEITVNEDGSVVFDPTANDTDPDGDPLWVKSVQPETQSGRLFWEDGGLLRYTPNPNYQNTDIAGSPKDTFTYTVTDGIDDATATVEVTVNSVNDPPVAFDDGQVFINSWTSPPEDPNQLVAIYQTGGFSLLSNDIDYDGSVAKVSAVDTTGTVGRVTVFDNGFATWEVPWDFVGSTTFKYRAVDDQGAESVSFDDQGSENDWATVRFWSVHEGTDPPTEVTDPNPYAIGDDPLSDNVLSRWDAGSDEAAVLVSAPGLGQMTSFTLDGNFTYLPSADRGDTQFRYALIGDGGMDITYVTAQMTSVNLTIYHGQNGPAVSELNERVAVGGAAGGNPLIPAFKATGAFTVTNWNDSDNDGVQDSTDDFIPPGIDPDSPAPGERDMMKLVMSKPAAMGNAKVTLTITGGGGAVRLWTDPWKGTGTQVTIANNTVQFAPDNSFPSELWVELGDVSTQVGDVTVKMGYGEASDTVNATGIWMKFNPAPGAAGWPDGYFMNGNSGLVFDPIRFRYALPPDADAEGLQGIYNIYTQIGLGLNDKIWIDRIANGATVYDVYSSAIEELSKFQVQPSGLTPFVVLGIMDIDTARTVYQQHVRQVLDVGADELHDYTPPNNSEDADDDPNSDDEDDDLVYNSGRTATDFMYSIDGPNPGPWYGTATQVFQLQPDKSGIAEKEWIVRANFLDFVRVQIGEKFPEDGGDGLLGSRASVYYGWYAMYHMKATLPARATVWTLDRVNDNNLNENRVDKGFIDVTKAGG